MAVKQYGSGLGHRILLLLYRSFGYRPVSYILDLVALYYVVFTPSVKRSLTSYYEHLGLKLSYRAYFRHIRMFALSVFDRFVSRIDPEGLEFIKKNQDAFYTLKDGGMVLLSHVGGYSTAAHCLKADIPPMHIVMKEETKKDINSVENDLKRKNADSVRIIDLSQGSITANIQIANAIMDKEVVAMMTDRVVDKNRVIEVHFLGSKVLINKNPFEIALRLNIPVIAAFVMNSGIKRYNLIFETIETRDSTIEKMAQEYTDRLEEVLRKYPEQWYNFYDFFMVEDE